MKCENCNYPKTDIVYTRTDDTMDSVRRRRECYKCGFRFTTREVEALKKRHSYRSVPPRGTLDK